MSSPGDFDTESGTRPAFLPGAVPAPHSPHDARDPWLRIGPEDGVTLPLAGQPGQGRMAFFRRQHARIADGRIEGGYSTFEVTCPSRCDHPYLDYSEVPPQLQRLRGPRTLEAGLAEYDKHLGLLYRPDL
jgi:hypothetical protein